MKHAIVFDEKNKSAEITIEQLARTIELGDNMGNLPKQCPVQPGVLLMGISQTVERHLGIVPEMKPIVIREPYCQTNRKKIKEGGNLELEDYVIKRMVAKLEIPKLAFANTRDAMSPGIALSYCYSDDRKGITVAFGENVHVCENLTTFGRYTFSTYGSSKVGYEEGMQLLEHWIQNLDVLHAAHVDTVQQLMNISVPKERFHQIMGSLFERAVRFNEGFKINAPLNVGDCTAMVRAGGRMLDEQDSFTAWEIMNWGTDILKPHTSDMASLIGDTAAFNDFILEEFNVKVPEPI